MLVRAVDLERGEALHGLEEHTAQVDVAAPVLRADLLCVTHHHHDGDGDDGHADKQQRGGKAGLPHEQDEQGDRCQTGKEELRQVAAKVDLELRGALNARLHGLGGRDGLGIRRAECAELVVHECAHAAHGGKGRPVARTLREVDARCAQGDGGAERGQGVAQRMHRARRAKAADKDTLDESREDPHHGDVAGERDPFEHDACNDVGGRLGNEGEEALLEHGTSGAGIRVVCSVNRSKQKRHRARSAPVPMVFSRRAVQCQDVWHRSSRCIPAEKETLLSSTRKTLKILSFLAIVGGVDLAITLFVLQGQDYAPELLQSIVMGLAALFALLLGGQGISVANRPSRAKNALPILLVALLVSAADVVLSIMSGGTAAISVIINALIVVAITNFLTKIYKEQQQ